MSQKKGRVPPHIQSKQFQHPGVGSPWELILNQVEDPRQPSCNTRHSVTTILFIVFVTVLCGAKNWEDLSLIRKIALGVLTRDTTVKKGRATKQMKAVGSAKYRDHLLKNCF